MRIGIFWHNQYPWDIRIEKFFEALVKAGNDVIIIARGGSGSLSQEGNIRRLAALPLFFNPVWLYEAIKVVKAEKLDVIIVRDLPLAWVIGVIGRFLRKPVIMDMAENYPAALLAYQNKWYKLFLFANAWLPRTYEKIALKLIDRVIVVAEEQKERLIRLGYDAKRIVIVGNTPDHGKLAHLSQRAMNADDTKESYILYTGFIDVHRGIKTLILAFNEIKNKFPSLKLFLIGQGKVVPALKELARDLGLNNRVIFKGWMNFEDIPAYIKNSRICVIPHIKNEHTETTMPNKIFDYLYFDKQVIVTDIKPLARIVAEARSGLTFRSGEYLDLSAKIELVLNDRDLAPNAHSGRELVEKKYNWAVDSRELNKLIIEMAPRHDQKN